VFTILFKLHTEFAQNTGNAIIFYKLFPQLDMKPSLKR